MGICRSDLCSGCGACVNICPYQCIQLEEDRLGVKVPVINQEECTECGICKHVCPQNSYIQSYIPKRCYAAYRKDGEKRMDSSSGGVAAVLYETFLERWNKNSIVYGVVFDDKCNAIFVGTECVDEIEFFKGSKYVQADTGVIFQDILNFLINGRHVLYVGTPCQVAACIKILQFKNVDIKNLLTVDLLCHGVSPQRYLSENLNYLRKKYKWIKIKKVSFRSNRTYQNFHFTIIANNKQRRVEYNRYAHENPYFFGFLEGITLRESCYNCKFSESARISDLTLGDFIGLAEQENSVPYNGKKYNASMILCNTDKGKQFIELCEDKMYLSERPYEEAVSGGASLQNPFKKHELRELFLEIYNEKGYVASIKKIVGKRMVINTIKASLTRSIKMYIIRKKWDIKIKVLFGKRI